MAADQHESFERFRRPTRRDTFLAAMERLVPWQELCAVIEPHYPKAGNGRPPVGLERMLRIYFVQHWFNLADQACEEALLDSVALRRFVGIDLDRQRVPDATTLLKFRRRLEDNKLGQALFAKVGQVLQDQGMKLHIGVDAKTGLAHSAVVTAANVHDKHPLPQLLHGAEEQVYGDSAYASQQELIGAKAPQAKDCTNQRVKGSGIAAELTRLVNRAKSKVRSKVEHMFAVLKRLWGFSKVRYRGLQKNATRSFVALGLANIYLSRTWLKA